jgi:hypothetical protein
METSDISTVENWQTKLKKKLKAFLIKGSILFFSLFTLFILSIYYFNYSTGVRAGHVIKISNRGVVFKTFEGQLDIESFGALKSSTNQFTQTFYFSVRNTNLAKELEAVALTGERVNLHYEEKYYALPWLGETKYFVTRVERAAP